MPEWAYNSNDPRCVHLQIMNSLTNWNPVRQYTKSASGSSDGWLPPPPEEKPGTTIDKGRPIMEGDIDNVDLFVLLTSISKDCLTGHMEIEAGEKTAVIFMNDGNPVHCHFAGKQ